MNVFVAVIDPLQPSKVHHPLAEVLTVAACGIQVGADTFEEIELWVKEKLP